MRAAVFEGVRQPLVVREMPDPTVAPDGVVMRVEANGICRTDWHLWTGDWTWGGLALPTPPVFGPSRSGDILRSLADISAARETLGYAPSVSRDDGLKLTVDWLKTQKL